MFNTVDQNIPTLKDVDNIIFENFFTASDSDASLIIHRNSIILYIHDLIHNAIDHFKIIFFS